MKPLFSFIALVCFILSTIQGLKAEEKELFVLGRDYRDDFGNVRGEHYDYFLKASQLPPKVSWSPRTERFPVELGAESRKALEFLRRDNQTTNQVDLTGITISRLCLTNFMPESQTQSAGVLSNHWIIAFEFQIQPGPSHRFVVMLLDGSYATEKNRSIGDLRTGSYGVAQGQTLNQLSRLELPEPKRHHYELSPYDKLMKADSTVSQIQWNTSNKFPLELNSQQALARHYLSKGKSVADESLTLEEVAIQHYIPLEAINANGLDFLKNRHHWFIAFRYRVQSESEEREYCVFSLLDGRIFLVTEVK